MLRIFSAAQCAEDVIESDAISDRMESDDIRVRYRYIYAKTGMEMMDTVGDMANTNGPARTDIHSL